MKKPSWTWPLKNYQEIPEQAKFGATRKYDRHTGTDLYAKVGSVVMAVEEGTVVSIGDFTGPTAGSDWWLPTSFAMIEGRSGVVLYGEIETSLRVGDFVSAGQIIGIVERVLKKDKGLPASMLHLELYKSGTAEPCWWKLDEDQPLCLEDPSKFLKSAKKD